MALTTDTNCTVEFQPLGTCIEVAAGTSLMQAAHQSGIPLASDCGRRGSCGRCRVEVLSGSVSLADSDEKATLKRIKSSILERLACRTRLQGNAKINVPKASRAYDQVLQLQGRLRPAEGAPRIASIDVALAPPDLNDQRSDLKRLKDAMPTSHIKDWRVHPRFARRLSEILRAYDGRLTVFFKDGVLAGLAPRGMAPMGIAVDIGTSTIAGSLLSLESGAEICSTGMVNPQIAVGEDIISRLDYVIRTSGGGRKLADLLREAINDLAKILCDTGGVSPDQVTDITICGNTAISHLLLRLPVSPLARAPYIAGFSTPLEIAAGELGIRHTPCAHVMVMPCIEGFVGGDHVAMILACDLDRCSDTALGLDIGTNTEIVLSKPGHDGGMFVTSCACGPAFEGAHIRDGMRAAAGAIEQVQITVDGPIVKTVDNVPPVGLCGSGLIDTLAELLRIGIVDERGHLQAKAANVRSGPEGLSYILIPAGASGSGRDILLTQKDISEIQLAKGAIRAGIQTLLDKTSTSAEEIACVYLAGAFGTHLNIHSTLAIDLLPDLPIARFLQAGNAAAVGASLALISKNEKDRATAIALNARHIELANDSEFSRLFVRAMRF